MDENEYKILAGKSEGKRQLQRHRADERIIFKWIQLTEGMIQWRAVVKMIIKLRVP
jgi:hypothetical protein